MARPHLKRLRPERPATAPKGPASAAGDGDLQSALSQFALGAAPPPPPPLAGIAGAIEAYTSTAAVAPAAALPSSFRAYSVREVTVVLGACAALLLGLDSQGLLTWARRMDVGAVQSGWLAIAGPLHQSMDALGLTRPRRALVASAEELTRALGTGEDPLLAEAWNTLDGVTTESAPQLPAIPRRLDVVAPAAGSTATVLLLGDSMMAGNLGATIARRLSRNPRLNVVESVQSATGLIRPDVFDWMKVVPPLLERLHPQLIVCSFGANDAQRVRQGDKVLDFGDPAWRALYTERVLTMMKALSQQGAQVLWLGLPPMREVGLSWRAQEINRIFAKTAKRVPGVEHLDLKMLIAGPDGDFRSFAGDADGKLARLRLEDGVHYSLEGAGVLAPWVIDWINERLAQRERRAAH